MGMGLGHVGRAKVLVERAENRCNAQDEADAVLAWARCGHVWYRLNELDRARATFKKAGQHVHGKDSWQKLKCFITLCGITDGWDFEEFVPSHRRGLCREPRPLDPGPGERMGSNPALKNRNAEDTLLVVGTKA